MRKSIDATHEWRKLEHFREGDYIRGLGQDMLVTRINMQGNLLCYFICLENKRNISKMYLEQSISHEKEQAKMNRMNH